MPIKSAAGCSLPHNEQCSNGIIYEHNSSGNSSSCWHVWYLCLLFFFLVSHPLKFSKWILFHCIIEVIIDVLNAVYCFFLFLLLGQLDWVGVSMFVDSYIANLPAREEVKMLCSIYLKRPMMERWRAFYSLCRAIPHLISPPYIIICRCAFWIALRGDSFEQFLSLNFGQKCLYVEYESLSLV